MNTEWFLLGEKLMPKSDIYSSIFDFHKDEPDEYFFNRTKNEWYDMPEFIQTGFIDYDIIQIVFDSEEDVEEFGEKYLNDRKFWNEKTWSTKGMWFPMKDKKRNSNLRYIQKSKADANPDIFDIVSMDEIQP